MAANPYANRFQNNWSGQLGRTNRNTGDISRLGAPQPGTGGVRQPIRHSATQGTGRRPTLTQSGTATGVYDPGTAAPRPTPGSVRQEQAAADENAAWNLWATAPEFLNGAWQFDPTSPGGRLMSQILGASNGLEGLWEIYGPSLGIDPYLLPSWIEQQVQTYRDMGYPNLDAAIRSLQGDVSRANYNYYQSQQPLPGTSATVQPVEDLEARQAYDPMAAMTQYMGQLMALLGQGGAAQTETPPPANAYLESLYGMPLVGL